jgi:peptidyl-prolyl cis-trans isomerase SurA
MKIATPARILLAGAALHAVLALPVAAQVAPPASTQPGQPARELPVDRVVAVVGDQPILMSSVQEIIYQRRAQGLPAPADSAAMAALIRQVVNELVDEELLLAKAKAEKVELTDEEVNTQVDRQVRAVRERFKTELEFRDALRQNGLGSPEEYRRGLVDQARRNAMQERLISKMRQDGKIVNGSVNEADVSEAFEKNKATLPKRPALVGFRQVVIATRPSTASRDAARAKAESLLAEVKKGADFEQVAKRESMDASNKEVGGDLGWIRRGATVPEFERWAFGLTPGVLSPVVETSFGFHVIRVDRVQPAEVKVRHILIMPKTDSTDVERGRVVGDSVATAWRAGASYDTLAARYHDQAGGEEKVLPEFDRAQLPESYQKAFEGRAQDDIVGPFQIANPRGAPKHVVAQVTTMKEGGDYTVADLRQSIRDQLAQERGIRRFLDGLKRETLVAVMLDDSAARP